MKKYYRGSYTVEAVMIVPMVFMVIFYGMRCGITLCAGVQESAAYSEELKELSGVEIFRGTEDVEELWEKMYGD